MSFAFFYFDRFEENESTDSSCSKLPDFRYEEIKKIISMVIEKYNIKKIPINVFELAKKLKITLVKYSDITEYEFGELEKNGISRDSDGFYALARKSNVLGPFIYYNDSKDIGRIRFTILHEIGHFILRHLQQSDLAEAEANFFAKYLIAPPVLVDKIKPTDYMDIACVFKISKNCAWYAFDYYGKWKRHHIKIGCNYTDYEWKILKICNLEIPESYRRLA